MTTDELLEKLVDAVSASTKTIKVLVPSNCFHARRGDFDEDDLEIVEPDKLVRAIQRIRDDESS